MESTADIHKDVAEVLAPFADRTNLSIQDVKVLLQFAWNRGYKAGFEDGEENEFENAKLRSTRAG